MKGILTKLDNQWMVRYIQEDPRDPLPELPLHPEYQTILPLDLDLEGNEVEFDWCVIVDHDTGKGQEYAKLLDEKVTCEYSGLPSVTSYTTAEYPELEGTMNLCNDIIEKKTGKMTEEEWVALNNAVPTRQEYSELEATVTLCNDMIWDSIYDQYSMEQYPPFGGRFTDSISIIDWLKQNYTAPKRIK